jgi:hypothetical protein
MLLVQHGGNNYAVKKLFKAFAISIFSFCPLPSAFCLLALVDVKYVESNKSANFPNFSLIEAIPQYLNQCRTEGRNKGMRAFRSWVKEQL